MSTNHLPLYDMSWGATKIHLRHQGTEVTLCGRTDLRRRPTVAEVSFEATCRRCLGFTSLVTPDDLAAKDRRLRAEMRAVEEGHRAIKAVGGHYEVVSDTYVDDEFKAVRYRIDAVPVGSRWMFKCTCPHGSLARDPVCKHMQLVARRLEREKRAVLVDDEPHEQWAVIGYEPPPLPPEPDVFDTEVVYRG